MTPHLGKPFPPMRQPKQPEGRHSGASCSTSTSHRVRPADLVLGKRPQGVRKARVQKPLQRNLRLKPKDNKQENSTTEEKPVRKAVRRVVSPADSIKLSSQNQPITPPLRDRKRKRETEDPSVEIPITPFAKRQQACVDSAAVRSADPGTRFGSIDSPIDPIDYWRRKQTWPKEYFEPDTMSHLLAKRRSTPSLRRKRSDSGSLPMSYNTPSDQRPREEKSAPYQDPRYITLLETKGIFMSEDSEGPEKESKNLCRRLLTEDQSVPQVSRFSDKIFKLTCGRIIGRNETKVIQDITRLIVPSAEELADFGAEHLACLIEAVNAGWNNSLPVTKTRPQPDYSVGFKRNAFTQEQLDKLAPFIGDFITGDQSFFMATYYMYFPFLSCEVKCGTAALDIADRQNAHSMTLAVRAVVELFRLVKRETEIDRKILAFSVSHDHRSVRIYGHYAVIDGSRTMFYHYPIHTFDFTSLDGREKWTAYKFIKNVYDTWMPIHFERLCSAIDDLPPELDFEVSSLPRDYRLSQDLESHHLSQSFAESTSQTGYDEGHSVIEDTTPNTSFTGQGVLKRLRSKGTK